MNIAHSAEVERGDRFRFGANWQRFLSAVSDQRIALAEQSLRLTARDCRFDGQTVPGHGRRVVQPRRPATRRRSPIG
jgi:hypothetical protein